MSLRRVVVQRALERQHCLSLLFPTTIYVEVTSVCNLKCPACVRTYSQRPRHHMDDKIFRKSLQEISQERPDLEHMGFHFFGEALLNPQFFDFVDLARSYLPRTYLDVSCNSALLDSNKIDKLLGSSLNSFGVWLDTIDPLQYEEIRKGGKLQEIESNIKELLEKRRFYHREDIEIYVGAVLYEHNLPLFQDFLQKWKIFCAKYDNVHIHAAESHDWAGQVPHQNVLNSVSKTGLSFKFPCPMVFKNCIISSGGEITPCCYDCNLNLILGDIKQDSIKNIWNGEKAVDLRERMLSASILPSDLCSQCHIYHCKVSTFLRILPATRFFARKFYDRYALENRVLTNFEQ